MRLSPSKIPALTPGPQSVSHTGVLHVQPANGEPPAASPLSSLCLCVLLQEPMMTELSLLMVLVSPLRQSHLEWVALWTARFFIFRLMLSAGLVKWSVDWLS